MQYKFIVIELFLNPHVVTDENGEVIQFDDIDSARKEADRCQDGLVIDIEKLRIERLQKFNTKNKDNEKFNDTTDYTV